MTDLAAEVEALATALGLMRRGSLDASFFSDPLGRVRTILSDSDQRAALLTAIDAVLPAAGEPRQEDGDFVSVHPIVATTTGNVGLSITRSGSATSPDVVVGLHADAHHDASGTVLQVELPLVLASGSTVAVVAGSPEHPLAVGVQVSVGWQKPDHPFALESIGLSALVLMPPDLERSRVVVELHGLDLGTGATTLTLDPMDLGDDLSHALTMLLLAGLRQSGVTSDEVQRLLDHLPVVLGLDALPPLPLGRLVSDAQAFRSWLAELVRTEVGGVNAFYRWVDELGQMLGAPALPPFAGSLPSPSNPLVVALADGGAAGTHVQLRTWLSTPPSGSAPELHVALDVHVEAEVARFAGRAELFAVPLGGTAPTQALPSAELVVESVEPLLPGPGGPLTVGPVRGGLRWNGARVVPVLELDTVHVDLPGVVEHATDFPRLDLTHAKTLAAEAKQVVGDFLSANLGIGDLAGAIGALLGFSLPPTPEQLGAFSNDPMRTIARFHREALEAGTYRDVAQQVATLFGAAAQLSGAGTSKDPWVAPLAQVASPQDAQDSALVLELRLWDTAENLDHHVHVGIGFVAPPAASPPSWSVALVAELVSFRIPADGPVRATLLDGVHGAFTAALPENATASVRADGIALTLDWQPGEALQTGARLTGVEVHLTDPPVILGDLALPDGLTPQLANEAWPAVRALLARAARSWGGSWGGAFAELVGLGSTTPGLPATWPELELAGSDVRQLLADPVGALRSQLAAVVGAAVDDAGRVPLLAALDLVRDLLAQAVPTLTGPPGPPIGAAVSGVGTYDDPWSIPLTDGETPIATAPVDLIVWLDPGPPPSWSRAARDLLDDVDSLPQALEGLAGLDAALASALAGLPGDTVSRWLTAMSTAVADTDGLTPADAALLAPPGMTVSSTLPFAAHGDAPRHPDVVTEVRAHLGAHDTTDLPLLLVGPSFASADAWSALIDDVTEAEVARVDLRVPGVDPAVVDLTTLTAAKRYLVDLADDGTADVAALVTRLGRVVERVCNLTGSAKVALVGHSIAGVAVVAYASAHTDRCQACVTVGTPFGAGPPAALHDPDAASGVRLVRSLLPDGLPLPGLDDAVRQLESALDGFTGVAPTPFPSDAFARTLPAGTDVHAVPTLGIWTTLETSVGSALAAGLGALVEAAPDPGQPTHLSWGLRARVDLGPDIALAVDVRARADLGRVALTDNAAEPARPAHGFALDALITRPGGWLVGSAGTGEALDVRLRAARLRYETSESGATFATTLYDGAVDGSGLPTLGLDDPRAARLTGAMTDALSNAAAAAGSAAHQLVELLTVLEVMAEASPGRWAMRADAVDALLSDPSGWFGTRTWALLETQPGLLGLTPDPPRAGLPRTWRRAVPGLPLELVVRDSPGAVGLRTTGTGIALADNAGLELTALVQADGGTAAEWDLDVAGLWLRGRGGQVLVDAPPLLDDLQIHPPPTDLADRLVDALGPTGLAAALSAALEDALGGFPIGSVVGLLHDPADWLADLRRLGDSAGAFDSAAINALLGTIGEATGLTTDTDGLVLAEGVHLAASSPSAGALRLGLTAEGLVLATDGPVLDLTLGLDVTGSGGNRTVRPSGSGGLTIPLSGGAWPSVGIDAALAEEGFTLSVTPGNGSPVPFLPHFPGLWDLLGGGVKALLPGVLDRLVQDLSPVTPGSLLEKVLAVADDLQLRSGQPPSFDSDKLAALVEDVAGGTAVPDPATVVAVVSGLLPAGSPVTVQPAAQGVQVAIDPLPTGGRASFTSDPAAAGGPLITLHLEELRLGPLTGGLAVSERDGAFGFDVALQVSIPTDLGFDFVPALEVSAFPLAIAFLPLGAGTQLQLQLAPDPGIAPDPTALGDLLVAWAEPIAAKAALEAARPLLDEVLWSPPAGTPLTAHALLRTVGLVVDDASGAAQLVRDLPDAPTTLRGLVAGLGELTIPVSPTLGVRVYTQGPTWLGLGLTGIIDIPAGDVIVSVRIGVDEVPDWAGFPPGLGLLLLDDSAGLTVRPAVRLGAVGLGVRSKAGLLVDTDVVDVGAVSALVQAAIDLDGGVSVPTLHGGVWLTQIGLPLGGSSNPANPIAASLLKPAGAPGDDKPASPPADLAVVSNDSGALTVLINAKAAEQPFFVDIHKTFGPLHIDRIGLRHLVMGGAGDGIGALVDGGVAIAGLTVDVAGLELDIPLKHPTELDQWRIDLDGLAMSFSAGPVSIEGGLLKTTGPSGVVEYDGQVKIQVAAFGLTAIAGYAQAVEGGQTYTSLFVFVTVNAPLGGPPFLFVTGLAGGAGYNRQLIVPTDPNLIPSYPLVRAMSDGVGTDAMGALHQMSKAMPPRRGSYWVAAGVKFTTFELINTKALAYVALDRGFEVGVMGLMTMALPTPDTALVSVELALLARYSTADQLLALRAQLTNNSWLISKDCQLTGGFAFYSWFGDRPSVYFTIGGHGPLWDPDEAHPEPDVPAVGFRWSVMSGVVVKGEFYFALSPKQIAFGGRLEASAEFGPIRVWFGVWLDVWLEWDPLKYGARAGITIGAAFHFTIDLLFTSITINISISIGGSITLAGPPLHGSVTVDLEIASVTVDFGSETEQPGLSWPEFAGKFLGLLAGPDPNPESSGEKTSVATVAYGQLADSTKGPGHSGETPDGTHGKPWKVLVEFGVNVAAKMPVDTAQLGGRVVNGGAGATTGPFDIKPMGSSGAPYAAHLELRIQAATAGGWVDIDTSRVVLGPGVDHFPIAVWLRGNEQPPPEHRDMWRSLAGATLAFPVTTSEATGVLGENSSIPVSTLVAEGDTVKPLPFTTTPQVLTQRLREQVVARAADARSARDDTARARAAAPRLVASLRRGRPPVTATRRVGTVAHAALAQASRDNADPGATVTVEPGEAHVWAAPTVGARFEARGDGDVRVTTLSATGFVLDDREGPAAQMAFDVHDHAARVVVSGLGSTTPDVAPAMGAVRMAAATETAPAAGWQSHSSLTQVAGDTLLAPGCAVLLPTKVQAHEPDGVERMVSAARVMSQVRGAQTLLPPDVDVVVVLLDELDADVSDDVVVRAGDGRAGSGALGPAALVVSGERRCLVHEVVERPADGARLSVSVASARAWRLAGVVGLRGTGAQWVRTLGQAPYVDLTGEGVDVPGSAVATAAAYVFSTREEVPA